MKLKSLITALMLGLAIMSFGVSNLNNRGSIDLAAAQVEKKVLQKEKSDQDGDGDEEEQSVAQLERLLKPIMPNGAKG